MSELDQSSPATSSQDVTGDINFQRLVKELDLGLIAVDPDWKLKFYNEKAEDFLIDRQEGRLTEESFWDSLSENFKDCFAVAYKKALVGKQDQLGFDSDYDPGKIDEYAIFDDMPLNLLEQKEIQYQFSCDELDSSYSVNIDFHDGYYILRIHDITDRVKSRLRAERNQEELEDAIKNLKEARDANPLTGLPGNIRIQEMLQSYLNENKNFALVYADLDNFKSFNDYYGFDRGDKAIQLTKKILEEAMEKFSSELNFLGHVGGDDFVLLTETEQYENICEWIIEKFDERVKSLYDAEDRENGGIQVEDRAGHTQSFGFMTVTLAVVPTRNRSFDKYLKLTEIAAELKSYAKENYEDSTYVVDRRSDLEGHIAEGIDDCGC